MRPRRLTAKKSRFTESQIVAIFKELDAGITATELGRKHGIHANTIRLWKDKYGGLDERLGSSEAIEAESAERSGDRAPYDGS